MRKTILIFALALSASFGCSEDTADGCQYAGNMRCDGNVAQICVWREAGASSWTEYATWQDCSAVGERCGYGPQACGGYNVACCR